MHRASHLLQAALERAHATWSRASSCSVSSATCTFLHLDWRQPLTPQPLAASSSPSRLSQAPSDFSRVDLIIASDVAYEPALTQVFFCALRTLLLAAAPHAKALVTLERRVNFSASLCDVVALDADVFADVSLLLLPPLPMYRSYMCISMPLVADATPTASCYRVSLAARCGLFAADHAALAGTDTCRCSWT